MTTRFANIQKEKRKGGLVPFLFSFFLFFGVSAVMIESFIVIIVLNLAAAFLLKLFFSRNAVEGGRSTRYTWFKYSDLSSRHRDKEYGDLKVKELKNIRVRDE